jgi:hypothetical protein
MSNAQHAICAVIPGCVHWHRKNDCGDIETEQKSPINAVPSWVRQSSEARHTLDDSLVLDNLVMLRQEDRQARQAPEGDGAALSADDTETATAVHAGAESSANNGALASGLSALPHVLAPDIAPAGARPMLPPGAYCPPFMLLQSVGIVSRHHAASC